MISGFIDNNVVRYVHPFVFIENRRNHHVEVYFRNVDTNDVSARESASGFGGILRQQSLRVNEKAFRRLAQRAISANECNWVVPA